MEKKNSTLQIWTDLLVEIINYIVIQYALLNMAMLLKHHILFIFLFAATIWFTSRLWQRVTETFHNKGVSLLVLVFCFCCVTALVCFVGRATGVVIPFWA